jgi:hypothetical protein
VEGATILDIGDALLGSRPCCIIFCGGHTLDPSMKIVNETTWGAKREDAAGEEKHAFLARERRLLLKDTVCIFKRSNYQSSQSSQCLGFGKARKRGKGTAGREPPPAG